MRNSLEKRTMTFIIRYEKTGKEIKIDNQRMFLRLSSSELKQLGFKGKELWEEE